MPEMGTDEMIGTGNTARWPRRAARWLWTECVRWRVGITDPAAVIAAIAAGAAAALSAFTLYLNGKREQKTWRRDAVVEAMVQFMEGSFGRYSERAFNTRRAGEPVERYEHRADDGLRRQNAALIRLRLLASNNIVSKAEAVQRADETVTSWFKHSDEDPTQTWGTLNGPRQNARQALLSAYRSEFDLGQAKEIISNRSRPQGDG
jgi:hypothetical protein